MRRFLIMCGNVLSQILALFTSLTAEEIRANFDAHLNDAMQAGRDAAANKRAELEQEIKENAQPSA
ncbi:MAG: hypothetical protein AAF846_29970 [Chloroflexota bacterium]